MKKTIALIFCLYFTTGTLPAKGLEKITWQENPKPHTLPGEYAMESAVVIEDNTVLEYKDDEDKALWMYRATHRIIKIIDESGVENFNKTTIPIYPGEVVIAIKARTILANGTVIEVSDDKMKKTTEEDGGSQIAFAMDGVEKNTEIELYIQYKKPAALFGKEVLQYGIPVMHATFELSSPARIRFEEKGYNGFPSANDTLIGDRRSLFVEKFKIPSLRKEPHSYIDANRMRAEYKASYKPLENNSVRLFTWQDLAQKLYANNYHLSDREAKAVEKYINTTGIAPGDNEEEKIKKIETTIKASITQYKELKGDDANRLDNVIDKKSATEGGIIRLFAACFLKAGVKHELGITTNRSSMVLDTDFENWNALENYLFYFPNMKKFLSPTYPYFRYPYTNTNVLNNKGVFCKLITLGDITNAVVDIRTITPEPAIESQNNITAILSFDGNMELTEDVAYTFSGYCAMGIRELAILLPEDKRKEMAQSILAPGDKPENTLKYSISGEAFDNYYTGKPLLFSATLKAPRLLEKAGSKYLLRIGDVIGKQSELYDSMERKMPIDFEYPHYLNRAITVNIPSGYKILNPEAIKLQTEFRNDAGKVTTAFYSDYKIDGSRLTVNISEFYTEIHIPISSYEPFRKVVNASADFNKITLLLAKQ